MTISQSMQDAFNKQINAEFSSSYMYLSMAAHFEAASLPGFAHWMRLQSSEEYSHAMKLFDFLHDRDGRVTLGPITQPQVEFESPMSVMEQTLEHEQHVTRLINQLYELSVKEEDYPAQVHLHWFITEQVEEEKTVRQIIDDLKLVGNQSDALLLFDRQMGARQATS